MAFFLAPLASMAGRFVATKVGGKVATFLGKEVGGKAIGSLAQQGAVLGGASWGANAAADRLWGSEDSEGKQQESGQETEQEGVAQAPPMPDYTQQPVQQQAYAPPQGYGQPVGYAPQPMYGQAPMYGQQYQAPGYQMPYAVPAYGAMPAMGGQQVQVPSTPGAVTEQAPQEPEKFAGTDDGMGKSMFKTVAAAMAGGVGGFLLKSKEEDHTTGDLIKGVMAGAGTGAFAKMGSEAIQKDGGGLMAGVNTAIASMFGSTLQEGGPGKISSALMGLGTGATANLAHDKLEESGHSALADAVGGGGLGGILGYTLDGDLKDAGIGAGGGAGLSTILGAGDRREGGLSELVTDNPLDKIKGLLGGNDSDKSAEADQQLEA